MKATIHSYNEGKRGPNRAAPKGKTTTVSSDTLKIEGSTSGVTIVASDGEWIGTGERGGEVRDIARKLTLELSQRDLTKIFREALASEAIKASVSIAQGTSKVKKTASN